MQYREDKKSGNQLSVLGFGCMRLPASRGRIDKEKSKQLIQRAYDCGINYYDTAYLYFGNEETVGAIFEELGIREKICIATKLPQTMCNSKDDFDSFFTEQKKRLRTGYIDYYLMHNISSFAQWEHLRKLGIEEWIASKKTSGEIHRIGFSYHGSSEEFKAMIDAYDWDFVQIQYNYVNIHYQAGMEGLKYAAAKGLSVIIMEPLLGGKLVNGLPAEVVRIMQEAKPESTPASWGLNWLWNQPEVSVILSGMNEMGQLDENLKLADQAVAGMFGAVEDAVIEKAIEAFNAGYKVRCTGCNYCMPCPKNINIPACFTAYNNSYVIGWKTALMQYMNAVGFIGDNPRFASDCVKCGKCESHCPQGIAIREELRRVKRRLEIPGIKPAGKIVRRMMQKV